jgi:AmmeMemoRadiSam system protein A
VDISPEHQSFLLKTACTTIRRRLEGAAGIPPATPPSPAVMNPAGCFVSLHTRQPHVLRGCIGRVDCATPLLEALQIASWQVTQDPRFAGNPITLAELPSLLIELSILGPLKPVAHPLEFEPLTDGLYLIVGNRSGVFLPQVARDSGWTRQQLLDRLCSEKLGLPPATWQSDAAKLYLFPTIILGPTGFLLENSAISPPPPAH